MLLLINPFISPVPSSELPPALTISNHFLGSSHGLLSCWWPTGWCLLRGTPWTTGQRLETCCFRALTVTSLFLTVRFCSGWRQNIPRTCSHHWRASSKLWAALCSSSGFGFLGLQHENTKSPNAGVPFQPSPTLGSWISFSWHLGKACFLAFEFC